MKIGIAGCKGRMGAMLMQEILLGRIPGLELAGGSVLPGEMAEGDFFITNDPGELFKKSDTVIDFTAPDATRQHIGLAAKHHKALVIGTTGLKAADEEDMQEAAKDTRIVYTANYSIGVNVLLALAESTAATLADDWDIEIFEAHHKHKIDAPSGTALALGKAAARGRKGNFEKLAEYHRHGETGSRHRGKIGFSVARGGDVAGEHRLYFYGEGERVELAHVAADRAIFARGALRAALWTKGRDNGLYSMRDVLGI